MNRSPASFTEERMIARLTALFGALALLLAVVGLYGVTAFAVARRTSEIGIRMALGANRTGVIAMVRGALIHIGIGLAIGIAAALLSVRFVESQLYEIKGIDAGVLLTAIFTLTAAACIAGMIPARRAASTDPARAPRSRSRRLSRTMPGRVKCDPSKLRSRRLLKRSL